MSTEVLALSPVNRCFMLVSIHVFTVIRWGVIDKFHRHYRNLMILMKCNTLSMHFIVLAKSCLHFGRWVLFTIDGLVIYFF